jgi:type IX secretion system PorP/SprF family membrane protein
MKKTVVIIFALLFTCRMYGQTLPLFENCFVDKYALSSDYAGNSENKTMFTSYRRDWVGVPSAGAGTLQVDYHDGYKTNAGFGGKIILDKIGIFQGLYGIATYSYRLKLADGQFLFFGISLGLHKNSIDWSDYSNDPQWTTDPSIMNKDIASTVRFVNDFSVVYSRNRFQAGAAYSNMNPGDYKYQGSTINYNPFLRCQFHANYSIPVQGPWAIVPWAIFRQGRLPVNWNWPSRPNTTI